MASDFIVAGLGNPGGEYARSPHNAGFLAVDKARTLCGAPRFAVKGKAAVSPGKWRGAKVLFLKPLTYMNLSGVEVARRVRAEGLLLERLIVCYDDLDLPFGSVRLRSSGGAGGHHGMESLLEELGSGEFPRIRIGVGNHGLTGEGVVDYLLSALEGERWAMMDEASEIAAKAAMEAVASGFTAAMNRFNRRLTRKIEG